MDFESVGAIGKKSAEEKVASSVARMESTPGAWKVDERVASMVFLLAEWSVEGWVLKQVILVASPMDE